MTIKTEAGLENAFNRCTRQRTFIQIDKTSYRDYRDEALADLVSAQRELEHGELKWAIVKAYQALFLQCTAILVKNEGIYSKDHGCLVIALLRHAVISEETLNKIEAMFKHKQDLFDEIDHIRISRNTALYFPKTQSKIGRSNAELIIEEVRSLITLLGEQL